MKSIPHIVSLIILYALSSCITNKQTDLLQKIHKEYPKIAPSEYEIIPGDQLAITVYSLDKKTAEAFRDFSSGFTNMNRGEATTRNVGEVRVVEAGSNQVLPITVYADGSIDFPFIGSVPVAGLTILEARNLISERLDSFAEGTSADVTLYNRYFSILGEFGARRINMDKEKITIYQALATSNTIGDYGDRSKVSIIRQTKDGSEIKTFDLRSDDIIDSEYYYIQANDVIYVPQSKAKFIGNTNSFTGVFSILTTVAGIVVLTFRLF